MARLASATWTRDLVIRTLESARVIIRSLILSIGLILIASMVAQGKPVAFPTKRMTNAQRFARGLPPNPPDQRFDPSHVRRNPARPSHTALIPGNSEETCDAWWIDTSTDIPYLGAWCLNNESVNKYSSVALPECVGNYYGALMCGGVNYGGSCFDCGMNADKLTCTCSNGLQNYTSTLDIGLCVSNIDGQLKCSDQVY